MIMSEVEPRNELSSAPNHTNPEITSLEGLDLNLSTHSTSMSFTR